MIKRKAYDFSPNYMHIVDAAWNREASRLPIYEQHFNRKLFKDIMGVDANDLQNSANSEERRKGYRMQWAFFRELGLDVGLFDFWVNPSMHGCGALDGGPGVIEDREDFEKYPWESIPDVFFQKIEPQIYALMETRPDDMMALGGAGNGPFEMVQNIVGYINLCYIRTDDEALFDDLFTYMGRAIEAIWTRFMRDYGEAFCVMRFCDDLGINHQTLLAPDDIRRCIIPTYRKVTDIVHKYEKPFVLHSCGNTNAVIDDIITKGGINAKHSNEDVIMPFAEVVARDGDRIGNFGGLDVSVLTTESPENIRKMTLECLEKIQGNGGIAFSSGSSVPEYVPIANYLAMNEAVRDWRGDKQI